MSRSEGSISTRISKSAGWLIGARLLSRLLGLISTVIVARILVPEDFGILALALSVVNIAEGISATGFWNALIRQSDVSEDDYNTVWTLNIIRGIILCILVLICAFVLPPLLHSPELSLLLIVFSLLPLLKSFTSPRTLAFVRELDFSKAFYIQIASRFFSVAMVIVVVLVWRTYWALVVGIFVDALAQAILSFLILVHRPSLTFSSARKILKFTIWLNGANALNAISHNFDRFVVNGFLATSFTGLFYMGQNVATLVTRELFEPLEAALFPGLAKFSQEAEKLRENILTSIESFAAIGLPIGFGFAFVAHEFVLLIFGVKWEPIVPMVQIVTPVLGIQTIMSVSRSALLTIGATSTLFYRSAWYLVARVACLVFGAYYFGFLGIIVGHAFSYFLEFVLNYAALLSKMSLPWLLPIKRAKRSLFSVALMSIALFLYQHYLPTSSDFGEWDLAFILASKFIVGATSYFGCHFLLWTLAKRPQGPEQQVLTMVISLGKRIRITK